MSQPRLQGRRVPGRLQPGARVPGGGGEDGHLPQAGVEAAQEAGPAGGLVGRGLAEDLVSEQRAQSSAQLQAGTPAPGRGEEENQEPAGITVSQWEEHGENSTHLVGLFISQKSSSIIGFLSLMKAKTGFCKKSHVAT